MNSEDQRVRQLGALIIRRRLDLGMKTKIRLAEETGLSTRVLGDIEAGKRRAGPVTYIQIENALGWPTGTISGYLDGTGSILDDEVLNATVNVTVAEAVGTASGNSRATALSDFDEEELWDEISRRRAQRGGSDYDRRTRAQDSVEDDNQDPGGIE